MGKNIQNELDEKGVSNNKFYRDVSDTLDTVMCWKGGYKSKSVYRALIHNIYHEYKSYEKEQYGNLEGALAEKKRAEEQAKIVGENFKPEILRTMYF